MSGAELAKLQALIDGRNVDAFYHWAAWERLRDEVLRLDNYECQLCKARGKHRRAVVVHHVQHVKDRPDLALSVWGDAGERVDGTLVLSPHSKVLGTRSMSVCESVVSR